MVTTRGINFYIRLIFAGIVTMTHHVIVHFIIPPKEGERLKRLKRQARKADNSQ